jgi:hypothetical protein
MLWLVGCEQPVTKKHSADSKSSSANQPKNLNVTKEAEQDGKAEQVLATEKKY